MTLDYCFFCHDKKHFFVVKGHFCSFLVSNICWLTSLSADYESHLWSDFSFHLTNDSFSFFISLKREALICGNYLIICFRCLVSSFLQSDFVLHCVLLLLLSAFQNLYSACNDPQACIVLHRDLIFLWMIILLDSDGRIAFVLRIALPNIFFFSEGLLLKPLRIYLYIGITSLCL